MSDVLNQRARLLKQLVECYKTEASQLRTEVEQHFEGLCSSPSRTLSNFQARCVEGCEDSVLQSLKERFGFDESKALAILEKIKLLNDSEMEQVSTQYEMAELAVHQKRKQKL